jgi:hypothetical protein
MVSPGQGCGSLERTTLEPGEGQIDQTQFPEGHQQRSRPEINADFFSLLLCASFYSLLMLRQLQQGAKTENAE